METGAFETTIADPVLDGLPVDGLGSPDFGFDSLAKAESRSAVIRSYIRLGFLLVD